jgi:CDP-6-deoxy-D-xylo-4-hexulose-3-dehydrase
MQDLKSTSSFYALGDQHLPHRIRVGTLRISERAKELVMNALDRNWLSYGPFTQEFEAEFASVHQCRFSLFSNSGTSALHIALQAIKEMHGWQDGDEVIIPAVTFVATANVVLQNNMLPVLVDVEPNYYELDPEMLEAKITPRSRAIIPVHLFGHPADMDPIREIADRHGLKIVEDSCETMFASYNGQRVGSLGDIGCFSTYVSHLLVTGVGGMSTTNNPDYALRMRSLMNHGRDSIYIRNDGDQNKNNAEPQMVAAKRFQFVSVGHSFRSTEIEAALGLAELEDWESMIEARRANARSLSQKLAHLGTLLRLPQIRPGSDHSFMMYPLVLADRPKTELVNFLEEHGVETRDMLPLTNQPVYQKLLNWREQDYPVAHWINQSGFYIGCHQDVSEEDTEYIAELFERFFCH